MAPSTFARYAAESNTNTGDTDAEAGDDVIAARTVAKGHSEEAVADTSGGMDAAELQALKWKRLAREEEEARISAVRQLEAAALAAEARQQDEEAALVEEEALVANARQQEEKQQRQRRNQETAASAAAQTATQMQQQQQQQQQARTDEVRIRIWGSRRSPP